MKPLRAKRRAIQQPLFGDYRLIPLTRKKVAIVDASDYAWLNQWDWHTKPSPDGKTFYAFRTITVSRGVRDNLHMARLILGLTETEIDADHINHDGLDNRRDNLRPATSTQNHGNQKRHAKGFKGVRPAKRKAKPKLGLPLPPGWYAYIRARDGKTKSLGVWPTPERAALAYDEAAMIVFEEFAHLNFPDGVVVEVEVPAETEKSF